ncbi:aldehyde dehydrogenase family protein [Pseudomonas asplenii]|uniref:aldehyde dehydrogenase family protein n=1 Tax=Pseudomonas asplenii TaxID=53407 RepID=UPI0037CBF718
MLDVSEDMDIMQEEIFGPLLPVRTYTHADEPMAYINAHSRPLAVYYFEMTRHNSSISRTGPPRAPW